MSQIATPAVSDAVAIDPADRPRAFSAAAATDVLDPPARRAQVAAARAGLDPAQVEQLPFDLSALEDDGVFLNVDARGFGLLDRRLDWQALGVTLPRGAALSFRPPRCGLLPDRHRLPLLRPAGRAHAALHRYSYRFQLTETLVRHITIR